MSILTTLRDRLSAREPTAGRSPDANAGPVANAAAPFAGYDRLDARQVMDGLSDHSQVELDAVESYERSHKSREAVLDKLRYMRGSEPLPSYDTLGVDEITAALKQADLPTIKRVRSYERKFANRPLVLDEVLRLHHERQAAKPGESARSQTAVSPAS